MKKLVLAIFLLALTSPAFAGDFIQIPDASGKICGKLSVKQFQLLVEAARAYTDEVEAEACNRVSVILVDTPYLYNSENKTYKARFKVVWVAEDGKILKEVVLDSLISIKPEQGQVVTAPEWRVLYTKIAEVGFPIAVTAVLTILLVLVAL